MKNILTFEEIWEIVRTGVSLGITHIRITGGEPLVRKGCVDLIRGIREIPGVETITMTTNGVLLGNYGKQLKEAGVDGVNISLDTLDPEEFYKITGKRELQEVHSRRASKPRKRRNPGGKDCRIAGKAECSE